MTRNKTTQQIAELLDVESRTVQVWVKAGCPCDPSTVRGQSHQFNEGEVANWLKETNRTCKPGRPTDSNAELRELKIRKEQLLIERFERENNLASGKLIDAAAERDRDVGKIRVIRSRLLGLGAALVPQLVGKESADMQTIIDNSIRQILSEFSKGYDYEPD